MNDPVEIAASLERTAEWLYEVVSPSAYDVVREGAQAIRELIADRDRLAHECQQLRAELDARRS